MSGRRSAGRGGRARFTSSRSSGVAVSGGGASVTLTSVSPTTGAVGTTITFTGTGFAAGQAVLIGGTAADNIVYTSSTSIDADVPSGAQGLGLVAVSVAGVTLANAVNVGADPWYDSGTQTLLFSDNFDSYTTFADVITGGWQGVNAGTSQDYTTDAVNGANLVITGRGGTGKAIRLKYDGISNGAGQEAHAWGRAASLGALGAKLGHTLYLSYWFRITAGAGYNLDTDDQITTNGNIVKVKWLELWNTAGGDRAQFNTSYSHCYNNAPDIATDGTGTLWEFYGSAGNSTTCQAGQGRAPWAYTGAGQWHRITHKYVTQSAPGARDGIAQMWYDGTLIVSVRAAYVNQLVPSGVNSAKWCQNADLDGFFTDNAVSRLTLGSVQTASLWPFTIDWDDFQVWRD